MFASAHEIVKLGGRRKSIASRYKCLNFILIAWLELLICPEDLVTADIEDLILWLRELRRVSHLL